MSYIYRIISLPLHKKNVKNIKGKQNHPAINVYKFPGRNRRHENMDHKTLTIFKQSTSNRNFTDIKANKCSS